MAVAISRISVPPSDRFFGKSKMPVTASGERTPILIFPPPGITRVSLNREHYYANPNPLAVSASKNERTSFGIRGPDGVFRRRLPAITAPAGLGRIVFLLDEWRAHGPDARIADAVKVSSNRSLVKERGVSLATPIVYQSRTRMSTTFFKEFHGYGFKRVPFIRGAFRDTPERPLCR